jgi:hypothetical protein
MAGQRIPDNSERTLSPASLARFGGEYETGVN